MTVTSGGDPLLNRLVRSGLTYRLMRERASPSGQRRETVPFEPPREAHQGQVNRPLHRESHGQIVFILLFINVLVVNSLLVLAGNGKRTRFLKEMEGGIT